MTTTIRLGAIALDSDDPRKLAAFYSQLTGAPVSYETDDFVAIGGDMWLTMHRIKEYTPPSWPEGNPGKQVHLDFATDDLDGAVEIAEGLGARLADHQPQPDNWRVMLDPAGHPFCFTTLLPD